MKNANIPAVIVVLFGMISSAMGQTNPTINRK